MKNWRDSSNRPYPGPAFPPKHGEVGEVVECRICGAFTPMLNTKLCDNCWEINRRIAGWSLWRHIKFWWRTRQ